MKRTYALLILFCFHSLALLAIEPPQLRCLSVNVGGDVTLTWLQPADIVDFERYEIYSTDDLATPFTLITQVFNANTITYTHVGADAVNNAHVYYYMKVFSTNGSFTSDTLATIELYLSNFGNGVAVMNWNAPILPLLPSFSNNYEVFKEYPTGTWSLIGTSPNLLFRDTIDVCSATIGYRVELADASGCQNVSRIQSDVFSDRTAPGILQIDSVSVNYNTSQVHLGWSTSPNPDASGYIIYHFENNLWVPIDTVWGHNNNSWIDALNGSDVPQQYRIAVLDSCMNSSPMSEAQHQIRLQSTYDLCRREATLTWDAYDNMFPDIEKYEIYFAENGGALQFAGTVDDHTHTFVLSNLVPLSTYDCIVKAVNVGETVSASSTKVSFLFNSTNNRDFVYICYVSVVNNASIEVKVFTGTTILFTKVHLYRSVGDAAHFVHYATAQFDGTDTYLFTDENVEVGRQLYYYRASIENECQVETALSNVSHNILLTGEALKGVNINSLHWTSYGGWQGNVSAYSLFRCTEVEPAFVSVWGGNSVDTLHNDDVAYLRTSGEKFSYYVEAQENMNAYGLNEKSVSNTFTLKQLPITYIPNAFCPGDRGGNTVFLPVHSFVTTENYNFYIYSRDGYLLFHTTNPNEGWDGIYNGKIMPLGVYIYKITYIYNDEVPVELVGTVTAVR